MGLKSGYLKYVVSTDEQKASKMSQVMLGIIIEVCAIPSGTFLKSEPSISRGLPNLAFKINYLLGSKQEN